jgi:hypothetical protein
MPCQSFDPETGEEAGVSERRKAKEKLDKLTRMLCLTCQRLEEAGFEFSGDFGSDELGTWWEEHQKQDARRRK